MSDTEFAKRLEKLERDNRRLKAFAFSVLILAAALGGIYAAQPIPQKITAHEFDVLDNSGKACIRIGVGGWPVIDILDKSQVPLITLAPGLSGKKRLYLSNDALTFSNNYAAVSQLMRGMTVDSGLKMVTGMDAANTNLRLRPRPPSIQILNVKSPAIEVQGSNGFMMDLGSTGTVNRSTGATQQTSAASIVMFGNDKEHHVIWKAP